jgi:E3 ubiquitin-protein ligase AMFR
MFPDYPLVAVIDDLRRTRSVDLTVENILDGRLLPTLPMFQQEPSPEASSEMAPEFTPQIESTTVKFVENPEERQQLLKSRKRDLLATARLRFIQKQAQTSNTS